MCGSVQRGTRCGIVPLEGSRNRGASQIAQQIHSYTVHAYEHEHVYEHEYKHEYVYDDSHRPFEQDPYKLPLAW